MPEGEVGGLRLPPEPPGVRGPRASDTSALRGARRQTYGRDKEARGLPLPGGQDWDRIT